MSNQFDFDNLSEEELIKILDQGGLTNEEFQELVATMKRKGMRGSIMAFDSPDSEESRVAIEYIEYHQKIPQEDYPKMPEEKIKWAKKTLFSEVSIEDKKKAIITLAHVGRLDVYKTLEKYEKNPDPELRIWINMAIQECQSFLKSDILEESVIDVGKVTKDRRKIKEESPGPYLSTIIPGQALPQGCPVKIFYKGEIAKITGKDFEEVIFGGENPVFADVLDFLFHTYPELEKKYPAGVLGFTLNGQPPQTFEPLREGDVVKFKKF
ncbi:hypothetical protein KKD19_06040 [Patescibacteria group bacterium]|nr:hypothetical protein [Patescibacteria group bacterium]MBU4512764.1 hypothetical protein [Patescibacteria group bacterium]MCG2693103.1 hypothetical protein [Candidatus Parcubacteria bacterium]